MSGEEGPSAGASVVASAESVNTPPGVETTATPITPETPIMPDGIPHEANPDDETGADAAANITDKVSTETGPDDLLKNFADGKTFTASQDAEVFKKHQKMMSGEQSDGLNEPNIKPNENPVTFGNPDEYRKNFSSVQPEDVDVSTASKNKTDLNTTQNTKDQAPSSTPLPDATPQSQTSETTKAGDQASPEPNPKTNQPPATENNQTADQATDQKTTTTNETPMDTKTDVKEPPTEDKKPEKSDNDKGGKKDDWEIVQEPTSAKWAAERIVELDKTIAETKQDLTNIEKLIKEKSEIYNKMPPTDWASKSPLIIELGKLDTQRSRLQNQQTGLENKKYEYSQKFKEPTPTADQATDQKKVSTNETPVDTKTDVKEPPTEDKKNDAEKNESFTTPGDAENQIKQQENTQGDEKEDPKSEETKKTEQMKKIDDYLNQMKDINPDFDAETFRKNLTENPDQWKTVDDALNVGDQMKTASKEFALKNPDLFKNSGITPEVFATLTAVGSLRTFSDAIEKAIAERTKNPNLTKEDEEKNKKDGLLLAFLKAVGLIITSTVAAGASTAFKEISKK